MCRLTAQIAFVTGASQGLGRGIALELAKAGADIVVADLNVKSAENVATEIKALGQNALALYLDVTDNVSISEAVEKAFHRFSCIDILVNNAGVMQHQTGLESSVEDFNYCYSVNVKGIWQVTQAFIPHFTGRCAGKIVNIASIGGRKGWAESPAYGASKAAVINLTQSLALSLGPSNINVNAVCPGLIKTAMMRKVMNLFLSPEGEKDDEQTFAERAAQHLPLRRLTTPEDVGQAVVFLASAQAKNITGQSLNVDGGTLLN